MAYDKIATIEKYVGLNADTKPTPIHSGSEFYEYDSARTSVYVRGAWRVKPNSFWRYVNKSITFAGATPNAIGDHDGTGDPADVFTVTGIVKVKLIAVCTTALTYDANATIERPSALVRKLTRASSPVPLTGEAGALSVKMYCTWPVTLSAKFLTRKPSARLRKLPGSTCTPSTRRTR